VHAAGLPAPWLYWTCTALVAVGVAGVLAATAVLWRRLGRGGRRRRFGQDTQAREATAADVRPLAIDTIVPPTGRMLLGRMAGHRQLLATEDRTRHPLTGRAARRQGSRGSVALVGPTGSGKTALATAAIATWDGPVVAVSVKRDLYDATAAVRARKARSPCSTPAPPPTSRPLAGHRSPRWPPRRGRCAPDAPSPKPSPAAASPTPSTGPSTARSSSAPSCASPASPNSCVTTARAPYRGCRSSSSPPG
jgi:hypothetical protein